MEISDWLLLNNNWLLVTEPLPKHCAGRWAPELSGVLAILRNRKERSKRTFGLHITCHDKQSKGIIECPKASLARRQIVEITVSLPISPCGLCKKHTSFLYMSVALWFENISAHLIFLFSISFLKLYNLRVIYQRMNINSGIKTTWQNNAPPSLAKIEKQWRRSYCYKLESPGFEMTVHSFDLFYINHNLGPGCPNSIQ